MPNKITLQFCEICVKMAFASKMVHKIRYSGLQKMNILSTKQITNVLPLANRLLIKTLVIYYLETKFVTRISLVKKGLFSRHTKMPFREKD